MLALFSNLAVKDWFLLLKTSTLEHTLANKYFANYIHLKKGSKEHLHPEMRNFLFPNLNHFIFRKF